MILRDSGNFRSLWLGQVVSVIGDGMQRIALLWWAYHVGGNLVVGAMAICGVVPLVACSTWGGSLADRMDRRRLLLLSDLLRLTVTAVLATLILIGHAPPLLACALVAVSAFGTAIFDPTYAAAVPSVVPHADRPEANGLNMANSAVGGLAGPLLGGALIAGSNVGVVLVINAATFGWSLLFIWFTTLPPPPAVAAGERGTPQARGAVAEVLRDRQIRGLVGLAAVLNMVVAPVPLLIVALAVERFQVGPGAFGVLQLMISAGILIGSLAAAPLSRGSLATPMVTVGSCLALVGSLPYAGSATALVVGGGAIAVANTMLLTRFQNTVPEESHGRVFGALGGIAEALRPAGMVLAAPLLSGMGVSGAFLVVGAGVVVATIVWSRTGGGPDGGQVVESGHPVDGAVGSRDHSGSTGPDHQESVIDGAITTRSG
jgi:MFS family permease